MFSKGRAVDLGVRDRLNGTHEWECSGVCTAQSKVFTDWMIIGEMPKIALTGIEKVGERDFSSLAIGHRSYQEFPSNNLLHPNSTFWYIYFIASSFFLCKNSWFTI
jgi:hypothetical protein